RSIAPGSSGLGKATVGKSGSGSACAETSIGAGNPAAAAAARTVAAPTPWSEVWTQVTSRGPSGTREAARLTYEAIAVSPISVQPSPRGRSLIDPAAIRAS